MDSDLRTTDEKYADLIRRCLAGEAVTTRNSLCYRALCVSYRFTSTPLVGVRRTAWKNCLREWEWFMSGSNRLEDLHPAVRHWWEPFCPIDPHTLPHNYGKALRRIYAPEVGPVVNTPRVSLADDGPPLVPQFPRREVAAGTAKHLGYTGTNCHGDAFRVVGYLGDSNYLVQFDSNGYCVRSKPANFLRGTVKNPYYPTVNGVGCFGVVDQDAYSYYDRAYALWCGFMGRCYNPARRSYQWYGGRGVRVARRWKCFEYFIADLSRVPGFEEWVASPGEYDLDKDYRKADFYGPEVCVFLPRARNVALASAERFYEVPRRVIEIDQIANLIEGLKAHPNGRRHVITTWIPHHVESGLINPTNCHNTVTQLFVVGGAVCMKTYQRSADVVCGVPHNWLQQWAFLLWLARRAGRPAGWLEWEGGDCHVYQAHVPLASRILDAAPGVVPELAYRDGAGEEFRADDFELSGPYVPTITERAEMIV